MDEKYKPIMIAFIAVMLLISIVFLYIMAKNSYYIKNHPCEICVKKYGSTCYLNGAAYSWNKDKNSIELYRAILPIINKEDKDIGVVISKEELDKLFDKYYVEGINGSINS